MLSTVPYVAVQLVAPAPVNCCVAPRLSETEVGAMVWALGFTRVTVDEADPPAPVAVTFTVFEEGIVVGAV